MFPTKERLLLGIGLLVLALLFYFSWTVLPETLRLVTLFFVVLLSFVIARRHAAFFSRVRWVIYVFILFVSILELYRYPTYFYDKELSHLDSYMESLQDLSVLAPQEGESPFRVAVPAGQSAFGPSVGNIAGFNDVWGYGNPVTYKLFNFFSKTLVGESRFYDLLNVKYFAGDDSLQTQLKEKDPPALVIENVFRPTYEQNIRRNTHIYENTDRFGHAWLTQKYLLVESDDEALAKVQEINAREQTVLNKNSLSAETLSQLEQIPATGNEQASITLAEYGPNTIRYAAKTDVSALFVLSELSFPGWRVSVNGAPQELLEPDYFLRGVVLPPGENTIEFSYFPKTLRYGLGAIGVVVIWFVISLWFFGRKRALPTRAATSD
jgi:hypothetical protein